MIVLKIKELCAKRNIDTAYQLQMLCELSPTTASDLFDGKIKRLSLDKDATLDKLCWGLECQVGDLLVYVPDKNKKPPVKSTLKRGRPHKMPTSKSSGRLGSKILDKIKTKRKK